MAQRNKNGQFVKGHVGAGGRPTAGREKRYMEAFKKACTYPEWTAIIKRAVRDALNGTAQVRHQARNFLAGYLIGTPVQRVAQTDSSGENPYMSMTDAHLLKIAVYTVYFPDYYIQLIIVIKS